METDRNPQSNGPELPYWHVWTDENGVSRQDRCRLAGFAFASVSEGAAPSWIERLKTPAACVVVPVLPAGWVGEWHENPQPQWIVPLSGRWFVETMDGTRVEMGPGELSFGNDQNTRPDERGAEGPPVGDRGRRARGADARAGEGRPCPGRPLPAGIGDTDQGKDR